jgi:hypothetical protein
VGRAAFFETREGLTGDQVTSNNVVVCVPTCGRCPPSPTPRARSHRAECKRGRGGELGRLSVRGACRDPTDSIEQTGRQAVTLVV